MEINLYFPFVVTRFGCLKYRMEERRVKRFQIGDICSPSSFVPAKRKPGKSIAKLKVSRSNVKCICNFLKLFHKKYFFILSFSVVGFFVLFPHDSYISEIV